MKKLPRLLRICLICKQNFEVREKSKRKFCSRKCYVVDWTIRSVEFRGNRKGIPSWNKGMKFPYEPRFWQRGVRRSPSSEFKITTGSGANIVLHRWVAKQLGKPNECELCAKKDIKMEWANISSEYKRDVRDWARLCISCHRRFDSGKRWRQHKEFFERTIKIISKK